MSVPRNVFASSQRVLFWKVKNIERFSAFFISWITSGSPNLLIFEHGHEKVTEEDILQAEHAYSYDLLCDVSFELKDVSPDYADVPYAFINSNTLLSKEAIEKKLTDGGLLPDKIEQAITLLLWFGFLGVCVGADEEVYSYQFQHDIKRMQIPKEKTVYCVHPGFRAALGCN
jgi:hypothetical protein